MTALYCLKKKLLKHNNRRIKESNIKEQIEQILRKTAVIILI